MDIRLLDPEGRVLGWFGFDSADGKVGVVHPDAATEKKLVGNLWFKREYIAAAARLRLIRNQGEIIVPIIQRGTLAVFLFESFAFGIQQALEDVRDNPF